MFPVSLLPFPIDSALISNIVSNLLFLNPSTILLAGVFLLSFLSLKTLSAKLTFLGLSMLMSSVITYIVYQKDLKEEKKKQEKNSFDYDEKENLQFNSHLNKAEKELMLSKIFKK